MPKKLPRSALGAAGGAALLGLAALVAAPAQGQGDPPGNNGTVKINGEEIDAIPNNDPHVGCEFTVEFYGFDEGDLNATVTFTAIPPTDGGVLVEDTVPIGEDPAGGGTDLDAAVTYDLSAALADIDPHPEQGHHVRLDVNAEGSIGNDSKSKVFWVEGCEPPPPPTTTTPETTVPETTVPETTVPETTAPETTTTTPDTTTPGEPGEPGQPGEPGAGGQPGGTTPPAGPITGEPLLTG